MQVKPEQVEIVKYDVDHGDKRSQGSFAIEAKTPAGVLTGKGYTNSGGDVEEQEWSLDGTSLYGDFPDLGVPHFYAGFRAISRFEKNRETEAQEVLAAWLTDYTEG